MDFDQTERSMVKVRQGVAKIGEGDHSRALPPTGKRDLPGSPVRNYAKAPATQGQAECEDRRAATDMIA